MTNSTVKHNAISVQAELTLQGHVCNVIIQAENAAEAHEHLSGLLGNVQAGDQAPKKAGKSGGKSSATKKPADTAAENTTPAEDSAPAAEQSKPTGPVHEEAKQEAPVNPTPAEEKASDPEPTPTAQPTPAATDTAPEATATPSATATAEISKADLLEKAKELIATGDSGVAALGEILKKYSATRVSTVSDDSVAAVYAELDAALQAS